MIRGAFIGINKFRDPRIRELNGAVRDAKGLWSLFLDSYAGAAAELLIDETATLANVRSTLQEVLSRSAPEDLVIVSFSGHGTRNHRIVLHDSDTSSLDETTVGMGEVATLFKASKAKAILCIIDCCFSGGAPARVLEDSPVVRDIMNPVETLVGSGRIILAACKDNESAYESSTSRHGLLTQALLRVFVETKESIDLTSCMAKVLESVRVAAGQIGVVQTPVMLGYVEGGLTLPPCRIGSRYREVFPESCRRTITERVGELGLFGVSDRVIDEWSKRFTTLNGLQLEAVNRHQILDGNSLVVIAPTSAGKTFIGELAAAKANAEGKKAVFLLPYRALVNEKYDSFSTLYGDALDLRVIRCSGDHSDQASAFVRGKYDLALLTYEMFLNLVVRTPNALNQIGLIVLDEAQFITDPSRGLVVELLLTYLIAVRDQGLNPQLITLSAVIGDSNGLEQWLGCEKLITTQRPVPLVEGVLDRSGRFICLDGEGKEKSFQLFSPYEIQQRGEKPSMQDIIVPLVRKLTRDNEKVIVFRNMRGSAEGCARYLASDLGLNSVTSCLSSLPETDLSTTSLNLRQCLQGGVAFHNSNLNRDEKQTIERSFRNPTDPLRVLTATTTVAAGINTPASTVIIAEQEFVGEDGREFTVGEYKNMAGRAGRLGFNEQGKAIILANSRPEADNLFRKYVKGAPDGLKSQFKPAELDTWFIRLLAQVKRVPEADAVKLLTRTYGGFLANKQFPGWQHSTSIELTALLSRMINLGLVEREGDMIRLTLLGRACGESSLGFRSAMRVVELVKQIGPGLTPLQFVALVQVLEESDGGYTPLYKKGSKEGIRQTQATSSFGSNVVLLLRRFVDDHNDFLSRCKRAAILADWIAGVPLRTIEDKYSTTPFQGKIGYGDVRRFADATRFHLRSVFQIASVVFDQYAAQSESAELMARCLEVGLPMEAIGLLELPIALERGSYLVLYDKGYREAATVVKLTLGELVPLLGLLAANRLKEQCTLTSQQERA